MFFYLLQHYTPGQDLTNGQVIVKILIFGSLAYLFLHAFLYSDYGSKYPIVKTLRNYFWYLVLIDTVAVAVTYKQHFNTQNKDMNKISIQNHKKEIFNDNKITKEMEKDKDLDIFATEDNQTESNLTNTEHIDTIDQTFEQESEMRPEKQDTESLLDKFRST